MAKAKNEVAVIEKKVTQIELAAAGLSITTQAERDKAAELLLVAKAGQAQAVEMFDPQRASAWETYQIALGQLNKYKNPFITAERTIKDKIAEFDVEQDRRRQEEQDRLRREEEARVAKEREKLLKRAAKAKTEEKREELEEAAEAVMSYVPTVSAAPTSSVAGVSSRLVDKPEIVDAKKLLAAIGDGTLKIDIERFISFKMSTLEQYIKLTGATPPGVQIKKTASIAASKGGK